MNIPHSVHNNFGIKWKLVHSEDVKKERNKDFFFLYFCQRYVI